MTCSIELPILTTVKITYTIGMADRNLTDSYSKKRKRKNILEERIAQQRDTRRRRHAREDEERRGQEQV